MKRFSNILLIVDEDTDYSAALQRAITLTKSNQAHLTIGTVVDELPGEMQMEITAVTPVELREIVVAEKRDWVDKILDSVTRDGVSPEARVIVGKPFIEIIRRVLAHDHDLVIKCAEVSGGVRDMLFGSTDMHLMRKCPCPVWIIKPTEDRKYRSILAAVDQDPENPIKDALNRQILEIATSLALSEFSELHVVHAWELAGEEYFRSVRSGLSHAKVDAMVEEESYARRRWLDGLVKAYGTRADKDVVDYLKPRLHVVKGAPKRVVPAMASEWDVGLVVMGTVGRSGIAGFFMGNTAESILNQIDCSVLTMKPAGFVSPIRP